MSNGNKEYRDLSARPVVPEVIEMEELPQEPRSISEECVKCGYHEANFEFIGMNIATVVSQNLQGSFTTIVNTGDNKSNDLILTCVRCGHSHLVPALDSDDTGVEDDTH